MTDPNRSNTAANILVVDDDPRIRELLRTSLEAESFVVFEAESSEELYKSLDTNPIDLVTMDILLDRENGLDLVRDIRRRSDLPIILVTGRVDLIDTVLGLELGADDYITKPFLIRELIARVRSVLRRSRVSAFNGSPSNMVRDEPSTQKIEFSNLTLNPASRELKNANQDVVPLTTTEYDLLEIFLASPQRVLTRDHLMEQLTGRDWHPSDRVIDNHVAQLRKKLETADAVGLIKTVRGAGYLFSSKVSRVSTKHALKAAEYS